MSTATLHKLAGYPEVSYHGGFVPRPSFCPVANCFDIVMVHNGEGQSSHVLVFCVNLELLEIISFTLKSNSYVYIAVLGLQYISC